MDKEFIEYLRKQMEGKTLGQVSLISGVSKGYIAQIVTGKKKTPQADILKKLSKALPCSYEELMEKAGYITPQQGKQPIKIPVLGVIPAGVPISAVEDIIDYEEISEDMAKHGEYFALKVRGDSMFPTIKDGDVVIIRQQDDAESGKICVVMINGDDATLKEIKKETNGIWILPHNPSSDFKPTFYSNKEIIDKPVRILGIAVEIRRSL